MVSPSLLELPFFGFANLGDLVFLIIVVVVVAFMANCGPLVVFCDDDDIIIVVVLLCWPHKSSGTSLSARL